MTDELNTNLAETLIRLELPRQIMTIIAQAGGEVRYVGGIVRDHLAGVPLAEDADIDMAGTLPPDKASEALSAKGLKVIPTGIDHGTITVMAKGKNAPKHKVELTTLRQDIRTDGRHAEVVFGTDWGADAARRDFTINSLYTDAEGRIFDPFGGVEDLKAGRVRFIGKASMRIREDYLRMLRYFRFFARFARGNADEEAMAAIQSERAGLKQISGERIASEVKRILASRSVAAIQAMKATEIDREIVQGGFDARDYAKLMELDLNLPPMISLGYLLGGASPGPVVERLRLSKAEGELLKKAVTKSDINILEGENWQCEAWRLSKESKIDMKTLAFLYAAWAIRQSGRVDADAFNRLSNWVLPLFPISGGDLMDRGFHEGEMLGQTLAKLEAHWIEQGFRPKRDELLNFLDALPSTR